MLAQASTSVGALAAIPLLLLVLAKRRATAVAARIANALVHTDVRASTLDALLLPSFVLAHAQTFIARVLGTKMTANARRQLRLGCRVKALLLAFFADVLAFLVHAESRAATVFAKCLAAPMLAKAPATAFLALAFKAVMEAALAAVACRTTRPALAPAAGMGAESIVVHLAVVTGLGAAFVGAQAYAAALDAFVFALLVLAQPPAATLFALILDAVMMTALPPRIVLGPFRLCCLSVVACCPRIACCHPSVVIFGAFHPRHTTETTAYTWARGGRRNKVDLALSNGQWLGRRRLAQRVSQCQLSVLNVLLVVVLPLS
mmetsp:Transcript_25676/g.41355  ORF Transcript_25676/g.41355 Transcript_25676/m.41355 type:complete len:318 (-) Transcript_25676:332-1285(-)